MLHWLVTTAPTVGADLTPLLPPGMSLGGAGLLLWWFLGQQTKMADRDVERQKELRQYEAKLREAERERDAQRLESALSQIASITETKARVAGVLAEITETQQAMTHDMRAIFAQIKESR